jgi:hypothetical protein
MINGAHAIIYSRNAEADRRFLRDVLKFPYVDVGHGWLIFGLPPAEVAVHPSDENERHELYLMCDDIRTVTRSLQEHGIECSAPHQERWGILTHVSLPGGGRLGIYQPRHPRPGKPAASRKAAAGTNRKSRGASR